MLAHPEIVDAVKRITEPFNVNHLAQVGARAALDDHQHLRASRKINAEGKVYLYRQLEEMGLKYVPSEANFIFFDTGKDCQMVFRELLSRGVIVRTGDILVIHLYPGHIGNRANSVLSNPTGILKT